MKRIFLLIAFCIGILTGFAQNEKGAVDLKNEGNDALRNKDYKKALVLFEQSIAKWDQPETDLAMIYNAGYCAYKTSKFKKAADFFSQSIDNNYKVSTAILYKANSLRKSGDEKGFVSTLQAGLTSNPSDSKIKGMLSKYYLKEGNAFYKAGAAILKGAANDVSSGKYTTNDALYKEASQNAKKEFKKALPFFEKALEITPDDDTAKQLKAACEQNING